jgi:hypothetical protein
MFRHFIEIFQHNQQHDTLLPVIPCAHKLKAGIAYLLFRDWLFIWSQAGPVNWDDSFNKALITALKFKNIQNDISKLTFKRSFMVRKKNSRYDSSRLVWTALIIPIKV